MDGQPAIEWLAFERTSFREPFFEQTAARVRTLPANAFAHVITPLGALDVFADAPPPDGLVLHMSRCGSTLVSRMLDAAPNHICLSEPPIFDTVLQMALCGIVPEHTVRLMAGALLRFRDKAITRGFLKLDSWHTLALPLLQRVLPDTAWVFLARHPGEVLASQARRPGMFVHKGAVRWETFGLTGADAVEAAEFPGWIIHQIAAAAAGYGDDQLTLFVDYDDLPGAALTRILPHFGITPDARMESLMRSAAARNSKSPEEFFTDDRAAKRAQAALSIQVPAGLAASYDRLRSLT
ncbi:hypothetical protein GRI62_12680 [Erythrobacter arachoides]|uniref:Sulfotransferase family protein n=1 Tax=Aurantiacibacter arachoides TaxID=1850444 RepID=A0A845A4V7_9SPHN|nr:hypothetical protein [Aurantiacibacter arachoides]MXO94452.1 hypothetical protein [Aurantiacibacter arachoides]GGD63333.1 hypothetical protein GCM10011411_24550 [Aurantiacibacter arachoides]